MPEKGKWRFRVRKTGNFFTYKGCLYTTVQAILQYELVVKILPFDTWVYLQTKHR